MSAARNLRRGRPPKAAAIKAARRAAGLTQKAAALLVQLGANNRWSEYERGVRVMEVARWELFLLLTHQHPTLRLEAFDLGQRLRDIVVGAGDEWTADLAAQLVPNGSSPSVAKAQRQLR